MLSALRRSGKRYIKINYYYYYYYEREEVFTNKQYRLGCSISIKMASQPCDGIIAVRVFTATLQFTLH